MLGWALLADTLPIYPLYALFFADTGLSEAQICPVWAMLKSGTPVTSSFTVAAG